MLTLRLPDGRAPVVRVASSFAPLVEARSPWPRAEPRGPLDEITALPCVPAFLFPAHTDLDDAVDAAVGARPDTISREIDDNDAAGYPVPPWVRDLARPGHLGTAARLVMRDELRRVGAEVTARAERTDVDVDVASWMDQTREALTENDADEVLPALHPTVRYRDHALHVQLGSGADATAAVSSELVLVPTLHRTPAVTTSSDPSRPTRVFVPVRATPSDPARAAEVLAALVGRGRSRVLTAVAAHPGRTNAELGVATELAAASVSDHVKALHAAGLVAVHHEGTHTRHALTRLGRDVVHRAGRP